MWASTSAVCYLLVYLRKSSFKLGSLPVSYGSSLPFVRILLDIKMLMTIFLLWNGKLEFWYERIRLLVQQCLCVWRCIFALNIACYPSHSCAWILWFTDSLILLVPWCCFLKDLFWEVLVILLWLWIYTPWPNSSIISPLSRTYLLLWLQKWPLVIACHFWHQSIFHFLAFNLILLLHDHLKFYT